MFKLIDYAFKGQNYVKFLLLPNYLTLSKAIKRHVQEFPICEMNIMLELTP